MLEFLVDNIFVVFGGKVFQQIVGIPMGTNCAALLADIFLYSYEAEFISLCSQLESSTSHTDTSLTYFQSITQILRIMWVRCIPLSLRSKTRRRETPLLPTWIYSCRSRVTVNCALPFTTNVTISTSISQTFRSWVAIFHLRQPMVFLSHSSYGMPSLLLLWMFYSMGSTTFILGPRTGICHWTFEIVAQGVLWSIWVSHQTLWSLPLPNGTWHSGTWPYTMIP